MIIATARPSHRGCVTIVSTIRRYTSLVVIVGPRHGNIREHYAGLGAIAQILALYLYRNMLSPAAQEPFPSGMAEPLSHRIHNANLLVN